MDIPTWFFTGENAIAGFTFAGLMFPGGEMPITQADLPALFLPVEDCRFRFAGD